jgi:hypothetical protein
MNKYKIDYDKKCLYLTYDNEDYSFHLDNGDIGDYWYSFFHKDQMYDINFHQESSESIPSFEVYDCKMGENNQWQINTMSYEIIPLNASIGNPNNYFEGK